MPTIYRLADGNAPEDRSHMTVLPAGRKEVTWFIEWVMTCTPKWAEAMYRRGRRTGDPDEIWWTFESRLPCEGAFV